MKYKPVVATYDDKEFKVMVLTKGNESDEELDIKAKEVLNRLFESEVVRKHIMGK